MADALPRTCAWITPSSSPSLSIVVFAESASSQAIRLNADLTTNGCERGGWDCVFVRVTPSRQRELDVALRGGPGTRSFSADRDPDYDLSPVAGRTDEDFAAWVALSPTAQVIAVGERLFSLVDPTEPLSVHRRVAHQPARDDYLAGPGGHYYTSNVDEAAELISQAFADGRCQRGLLTANTLEALGPGVLRDQALLPSLQRRLITADTRAVLVTLRSWSEIDSERVPLTVEKVRGRLGVAYSDGLDPIPVVHL